MTETATANNPNEASASLEAPVTPVATVTDGPGSKEQTQLVETPVVPTPEAAKESQQAEPAKVIAAPEKYTFTAPEGTEYDSGVLDAFSAAAKEANLSQDAAQKLIETMAPAIAARQADQIQAVHKAWLDASTADKEFGGEKLAENLGVARKALDNFGSPELRALLDNTGLGNHPEVLRFMFRAGKAISEDKFVTGAARTGSSDAKSLYPNSNMQ
jgi:hypothetical protein